MNFTNQKIFQKFIHALKLNNKLGSLWKFRHRILMKLENFEIF